MKLIDILVRELPKRGGWPGAVPSLVQDSFGGIYQAGGGKTLCVLERASDWGLAEITCEYYMDNILAVNSSGSLAASKQEWNGEGLPPVGCECMVRGEIGDDGWYECKIIAHTFFDGYDCAAFQTKSTVSVSSAGNFKPLRSEADKKREEAVTAMEHYDQSCESIYDAIAAGKIPGVKLED